MKFSKRIQEVESSPIRRLAPFAEMAKSRGLHVIPLNIGQPDIETPKEFISAIKEYPISILEYAPSQGLRRTLETTQLYLHNYGLEYAIDEIMITAGASEALSFAMMTICDPGDEILTIEPFYPNYQTFAKEADAELVGVTTEIENGFRLPPIEEFEKKITDRTRAILLSSPGNPTGRVYTKEEIDLLVSLALKYDLFVIADEVYREFNFMSRPFISFGDYKELEQNLILVDSISKKYSACGARIGSIASKNRQLMGHLLKLAQARLSVSTLDQVGAGVMDRVDDRFIENNRRIYKHRRNVLDQELKKIPNIQYSIPEGAFYTIVELPVEDAQDFVIWMIENISINGDTVLLTPAASFYSDKTKGQSQVRISYCVDEKEIVKAMAILKLALEKYSER